MIHLHKTTGGCVGKKLTSGILEPKNPTDVRVDWEIRAPEMGDPGVVVCDARSDHVMDWAETRDLIELEIARRMNEIVELRVALDTVDPYLSRGGITGHIRVPNVRDLKGPKVARFLEIVRVFIIGSLPSPTGGKRK